MASAAFGVLGDVAGALVGGLFGGGGSSDYVPAPIVVQPTEAPAVLDTEAAAESAAKSTIDQQRKKAQRMAALSKETTEQGKLSTAPSARTLLGD